MQAVKPARASEAPISFKKLRRLTDGSRPPAEIVNELYLATLSRPPTASESSTAVAAFGGGEGAEARRAAAEDVLWALLNSAEFVFNH